jgi:DGQHR domain-containing protein
MALEDQREISFSALKLSQPIGDFYIGSIKARDLFKIAFFDIRHLSGRDIDEYLGIQRQLNEKRVEEIRRYTHTIDATFPTAVILAVDERCAEVTPITCQDGENKINGLYSLKLRNIPQPEDGSEPVLFRQIARVIDGQHRIAGLEKYDGDFDVNVSVFIGLDIATQASVFSVVNLAQTKVNTSLVYDLFAYDKARSPEKSAHDLAVALDSTDGSPFHKRIKRLGVATEGRFGETLSQATFVRSILPHMTDDILLDRDTGRRGGHWAKPTHAEMNRMVLRYFFVNERDLDIAEIVWNYFGAISDKWPESWNWTGTGRILNKTTGFEALMRFFRPAYKAITGPAGIPRKDQFSTIFEAVNLGDKDFTTDTFKPGSSGTGALYQRLLQDTGIKP